MLTMEQASDRPLVPGAALVHRPAAARGHADHGWLKSAHSFSFASYYDPAHTQFDALRVINDDRVAPGGGFPMHPHQDFEIFSYVLEGQIAHEDSLGNGSIVGAGGVQYMTAGTGVRHSEFNPSRTDGLHFLQVWLQPGVRGAPPRYETLELDAAAKKGRLVPIVTEDGRDGSIRTLAPADVYASVFDHGDRTAFRLSAGRRAYVHVARGSLAVNDLPLAEGDGLYVNEAGRLDFSDGQDAEVLLFDLKRLVD